MISQRRLTGNFTLSMIFFAKSPAKPVSPKYQITTMADPYCQSEPLGLPGQFNGQHDLNAVNRLNQAGVAAGYQTRIYEMESKLGGLSAALDNGYTFFESEVDSKPLDGASTRQRSLAFDEACA